MNWSPCPWEKLEELNMHTQNRGPPPCSARGEPPPGNSHGAIQSDTVASLLLPGFTRISAVASLHLHPQARELRRTRANEAKSTQHKTTAAGLGHLCGGGSMEEGSGQWVGCPASVNLCDPMD